MLALKAGTAAREDLIHNRGEQQPIREPIQDRIAIVRVLFVGVLDLPPGRENPDAANNEPNEEKQHNEENDH